MQPGPSNSCIHSVGNPQPFLLGNSGRNSEHQLASHPGGAEVRFGVALKLDAVASQIADVLEGLKHSLAGKAIERPHHHHIEQPADASANSRLKASRSPVLPEA